MCSVADTDQEIKIFKAVASGELLDGCNEHEGEQSDSTSFKAEDFREDRGRSLEEAMKNK